MRAVAFSLIPLAAAMIFLRRTGVKLSRETLRPPFFAQCYLATPCCLAMGVGFILARRSELPSAAGQALIAAAAAWFIVTQARWFKSRLNIGWLNAGATTIWALICAFGYLIVLAAPLTFT